MTVLDLIAVLSFGLTCFSVGYSFGANNHEEKGPLDLSFECMAT